MNLQKYNILSKRNFIGHGGYIEVFRIAYPLIFMNASHTVMMFVDRLFLAKASTNYVAAALPAGTMYFTLVCIFSVTANFTSTLVAQFFGANDRTGCVKAVWSGLYFSAAASLYVVFIVPVVGKYIITHTGMQPDLIPPALEYLDGLWLSGIFACLGAPLFSFFTGRGVTWLVALIITIGCMLNIFLDYTLIFGKWGFPEWGMYGGAMATTICGGVSVFLIAICFLCYDQSKFPTRKYFQFDWRNVWKIIKYGTPAGAQVACDVGAFSFMTFLVSKMDVDAAAATAIALSINNLSFMPLIGLADATAIVSGQYIGRIRTKLAERATWRAWRMSWFYMGFCSIIYLTCPRFLAQLFSNPNSAANFSNVVEITTAILACAALFNMFDAVKFIFMGGLRGAGDTRMVFLLTSGSQWLIMVPGLLLLVYYFHSSILALWIFQTAYFGFEGAVILGRFLSGKWKNIKLISR